MTCYETFFRLIVKKFLNEVGLVHRALNEVKCVSCPLHVCPYSDFKTGIEKEHEQNDDDSFGNGMASDAHPDRGLMAPGQTQGPANLQTRRREPQSKIVPQRVCCWAATNGPEVGFGRSTSCTLVVYGRQWCHLDTVTGS